MQPESNKKSTNYINLIIAFVAGIIWAFFWAVDQLVAYLAFGTFSFFLVYYFYNRKIESDQRTSYRNEPQVKRTPASSTPSPFRSIFSQNPKDRANTIIRITVFGMVSMFIIAIAASIFLSNSTSGEEDSGLYFEKAEQYYNAGKYDSAYHFYKSAVREDENNEEAWLGLGNTLGMLHEKDSALILYNKAMSINPSYTVARYNIGWWYYDQKQYRQSIDYLKNLVVEDPSQLGAMQLIGDDFYELNQYDSALRWYDGAYINGSRSRWLCHVMAYIYDKNNQLDKAIPLYKEALEYDDSIVDIYVRLGELIAGEEGEKYRTKAAQLKAAGN